MVLRDFILVSRVYSTSRSKPRRGTSLLIFNPARYSFKGVPDERRSGLREPFSQLISVRVKSHGRSTMHQAEILDVSPYGARIRLSAALEPGDAVEFFSADDPKHPARYLVSWTGQSGSDLEGQVGLRFVSPPKDPNSKAN
jgi:hypothetical protein